MHPEDMNIYAPRRGIKTVRIIYLCLADSTLSYIYEKNKITYEPYNEKTFHKTGHTDSLGQRFENCNHNKVKK